MLFAPESSNNNAVPYERDTQTVVDQYGNTYGDVDKGILDTLDIRRGRHPDNTMITEGFHGDVPCAVETQQRLGSRLRDHR